jgi:hypothetical protein
MHAHNPLGCGHCQQARLLPLHREDWGGCAFCMVLSMTGTVIGWSFSLSFWLFYPDVRLVMGLVGVSLCFTVVLLLHLIAYALRAKKRAA